MTRQFAASLAVGGVGDNGGDDRVFLKHVCIEGEGGEGEGREGTKTATF